MHRREWIKKIGAGSVLAVPSTLLGDTHSSGAQSAFDQALRAITAGSSIKPDRRIILHVPTRAANGAVVPVGVVSNVPDTLKIVLLVNHHTRAKVAELDTSNAMLAPELSIHLQLTAAASITALVQTRTAWHGYSTDVNSLGERC